jgi:hypothetical protein
MSRNHKAPGDARRKESNKVRPLKPVDVADLRCVNLPTEGYYRRLAGIEEMREMLERLYPNQPANKIGPGIL